MNGPSPSEVINKFRMFMKFFENIVIFTMRVEGDGAVSDRAIYLPPGMLYISGNVRTLRTVLPVETKSHIVPSKL